MKKIVFNLMLLMISMGMSAQRITRQYNNTSVRDNELYLKAL